ncbi:MAG: septum formation initiator family protein [Elusimicrobia bacterium]|nr:septum formation initiator family protein [Elusimicrobiota bacterium]
MRTERLRVFLRAHWPRLVLALALLAVFFGNQGFRSLISNWLELRGLSREIATLEADNARAAARLKELRVSDAALEREVRKVGFVKSGELEYRFEPPKPSKR